MKSSVSDVLREALQQHTPLVLYRLPRRSEVHALIGGSTGTSGEAAFLFAPFDRDHAPLRISSGHARKLQFEPSSWSGRVGLSDKLDYQPQEDQTARERHLELVSTALKAIDQSCLEKVVLSRDIHIPFAVEDPFEAFFTMEALYPDAMVYLWFHPESGLWLGASPETLLKVSHRKFSTMALAGTRPDLGLPEADWTEKEYQEQEVVTRTILRQLEPMVAELKSGSRHTVKAGKLLHLCTQITGELSAGEGWISKLISVLHPTPAVAGLPLDRAMAFITEHEGYHREFYTGYFGLLDEKGGEAEVFVNLRCMKIESSGVRLFVGGGINSGSQPEAEWLETCRKAETMLEVLKQLSCTGR